MKAMNKIVGLFAFGMGVASLLSGCAADDPFQNGGDGEVRMRLVINSDVTRAEVDDDALRSNCVVYISNEKGLIHKYKGLENVPEQIRMKCGNYVAEAWTGDSVPASFDKKFYRGYQPFTVEQGINSPVVKCGIANVVASVNTSTIDPELMKDWTITIGHSNATLDFTAENADDAKGYFMMPSTDTQLSYTIKGKNASGQDFEKKGIIEGKAENGAVERAHEYVLNFSYNPEFEQLGGAFITVTIDDSELLVEEEIDIWGRPVIAGMDFDIDRQVVGNAGAFKNKVIKISAFNDIKSVVLKGSNEAMGVLNGSLDLLNHTASVAKELEDAGISYEKTFKEEKNLALIYITLSSAYLNSLPESNEEYRVEISVVDQAGKDYDAVLRIAVGEGAIVIEDPVTIEQIDQNADLLAVGGTTARLLATLQVENAENPGIEYRPADSDGAWTFVSLSEAVSGLRKRSVAKRAAGTQFKITLKGLTPGVRYAYRAVAKDFASAPYYFTTEQIFAIPNADMEGWNKWSNNSKVVIASTTQERNFWDSGNHGSATMSKTLTQGSSVMKTSGAYSAELKSQFVGLGSIGKFAAGNLFAGEYLETVGTDGKINFGSLYNGSHPTALRVMLNYRPGTVEKKGANDAYLAQGAQDIGHIFVALATQPYQVFTKSGSEQRLFNPGDETILAYGQKVLDSAYGPDGALQALEIPLEYYSRAKTKKPLYLIIVCTASKFGDYFCGGEGSLMYLDDFELIY